MSITVEDIIGSTGLELKVDPGVPWVYAGFAGIAIVAKHLECLLLPSQNSAPCALKHQLHFHFVMRNRLHSGNVSEECRAVRKSSYPRPGGAAE